MSVFVFVFVFAAITPASICSFSFTSAFKQRLMGGGGGGKEKKGGCEDQRTDHLRIVVAQLHFSSVCSNTTCRDTCSPAASVFAFHCSAAQSLDHRTSMRCVPGHKMSAT